MTDSIPMPIEDWSDMINLSTENGGAEGWGRFIDLLARFKMTLDMVGLSFGSSWTHNNSIWINLKASLMGQLSTMVLSINSSPFLHSIVAIPIGKLLFLKLYNNKRKLNWSTRYIWGRSKWWKTLWKYVHMMEDFVRAPDDKSHYSFFH